MFPPRKPHKPTFSFSKSSFLLISIASLSILSLISLLFLTLSSATHHNHRSPLPHFPKPLSISTQIHQACKATRYPDTCESSLSQSPNLPPNPNSLQILQFATWVSSQNLKTSQPMVQSILDTCAGNQNRTTVAKSCLEGLQNSEYRIQLTSAALPKGKIKDSRAWMSAALLFQYGCWSGLKSINDTSLVNSTMSFMNSLIGLTSNALSMMMAYDNFGDDTATWGPPKTERDGFWELDGESAGSGFNGGFPSGLKPDVTVCKGGGGGCYKTVQEAVNAAPNNAASRRFVIKINEGVYEEIVRVPLQKKNVVILGDGIGKTVITGSLNKEMPGMSTYNTATVGVLGDGFMASGLTIQNTAGSVAHQAVAFRSGSDMSVIENCEFIGNQDTLYVHSLRQFYKSCRIQGNVDFIFGNSAAYFQDCVILFSPRQVNPEKGEKNVVTAQGRTDPAQSTGFVFQNCLLNGTDEYMKLYYSKPKVHKNFMGRPWREYSRTVFINCNLEVLITPEGWLPWKDDFALQTLYYGEFNNSGPGSSTSDSDLV